MPKRVAIDRDGRITDERPLRQILTSWDRLQRLLRKDLPPWTGDPERMQAWVNAKLDAEHAKIDAAFDREMAAAVSLVLKAYAPLHRGAEEKRKRKLTIGRRESRKAFQSFA
ncbi:MAG: hypothetical protein WCD69_24000 [Xanthobacteraceae bacterium]